MGSEQELLERERELERIEELLRVAQSGSGSMVFVLGEPGVGKTRLVAEVGRIAHEAGTEISRARGAELERTVPFGLVRQLLEQRIATAARADQNAFFDGAAG